MKEALKPVLVLLIIIWIVEIVNLFTGHSLYIYGVLPREISGLKGILLHPFIHASLQHLISNSVPLVVLGFLVALDGTWQFVKTSIWIILCGGILLWLFGRSSFHVGASLLIFGYFGYVVMRAVSKKTISSVIIAILTIFFYGGLIYGLVPLNNHISWEGHLFGLLSGIMSAKIFK
jgi:membrane associated rhomboid family serine protease